MNDKSTQKMSAEIGVIKISRCDNMANKEDLLRIREICSYKMCTLVDFPTTFHTISKQVPRVCNTWDDKKEGIYSTVINFGSD